MTIIDIRVKYAREFGHSLDFVIILVERGSKHYTRWLEEQLCSK